MYKTRKGQRQLSFDGFNQSCGMKLNPKDEWVILADLIAWDAVEAEYSALFTSKRGRSAVSARQALGALVIQKRKRLSDRELVKEIAANVSYQYFIGLQTFRPECPFKHGVIPEFRKRLGKDFLVRVNEMFLRDAKPTPAHAGDKADAPAANGNIGTMILDATCSPSNVRFPQDFSLLNEAREKLDAMIDLMHDPHSGRRRLRTYRKVLRRKYLAVAKSRKHTAKQARATVCIMLCAVKRNMAFVDALLAAGGSLEGRPHHDQALGDYARQPRAVGSRGEPVRRPAPSSFFVLFHGRARRGVRVPPAGDRGRGGVMHLIPAPH